MSVYTAVPIQEPPTYEQRTLTLPARNLSQPEDPVTPLRYLGSGNPPPPPPSQAAPIKTVPLPAQTAPSHVVAVPAPVMAVSAAPAPRNPVDTVFFPVSDNLVAEHSIARLRHLAPDLCYLVVGHSDPTGSKPLILGLSLERAASVATVMRSAGLRVDLSGVGSYGASNESQDYPKDRRAEVWRHPCPGTPVPANPPPPPKPDLGGISVQVTQDADGKWQTVVTRSFKTRAAAQAWAIQMQEQPPMQADLGLPSVDFASIRSSIGTLPEVTVSPATWRQTP